MGHLRVSCVVFRYFRADLPILGNSAAPFSKSGPLFPSAQSRSSPVHDLDPSAGLRRKRQPPNAASLTRMVGINSTLFPDFLAEPRSPKPLIERTLQWASTRARTKAAMTCNGVVPRLVVMQEAVFREISQPRIARRLEIGVPCLASLGQTAQFLFRAEHDALDAPPACGQWSDPRSRGRQSPRLPRSKPSSAAPSARFSCPQPSRASATSPLSCD